MMKFQKLQKSMDSLKIGMMMKDMDRKGIQKHIFGVMMLQANTQRNSIQYNVNKYDSLFDNEGRSDFLIEYKHKIRIIFIVITLLVIGVIILLFQYNQEGFKGNRIKNLDSYMLDMERINGTDLHTLDLQKERFIFSVRRLNNNLKNQRWCIKINGKQ